MHDSAARSQQPRPAASPAQPVHATAPLAHTLNSSPRAVAQRALAAQLNRGGLPENLRNGVERLSGVSMAGVRVHYNSAKPTQLNAEAYAQGRDIHLAPGKAHHLPHEAWHVAQQAQGRVKPTMQLQEAVPINDDKRLEKEADTMGKKAAALGGVAQRAVPTKPTQVGVNKPVPDTGGAYNAGTGNEEVFLISQYPRSDFSFGPNIRKSVLSKPENFPTTNAPFGPLVDPETVRVVTGTQENTRGVQLDHRTSWQTISKAMQDRNESYFGNATGAWTYTTNYDQWFSFWDAKMYYNDVTNLFPVLGNDNASAGKLGVQNIVPPVDPGVAAQVAQIHQKWLTTQKLINKKDLSKFNAMSITGEIAPIETALDSAITTLDDPTTNKKPPVSPKTVKLNKKIQKAKKTPIKSKNKKKK